MTQTKEFYEGWNKGKDLTPEDLVVLPNKEKGFQIYLRIGSPFPFYTREIENLHTKFFIITSEEKPTKSNIKDVRLDFCDTIIENLERIKKYLLLKKHL